MTTRAERRRIGDSIRAELGFIDNTPETELAPGLSRLSSELVFGTVWARPGLDRPDPTAC